MIKLDVLFLGGLFPKEMEREIYGKSIYKIQNAANVHQWGIINGLDNVLDTPVNILNLLFIGSYPKKYKDIYIKPYEFSHINGAKDKGVGFLNLTVIKQIYMGTVLNKPLKDWAKRNSENKKVLIIYSAQNVFLNAAKRIKQYNKNIHICLIVPDLPAYMNIDKDKNILYRIFKKFSVKNVFNKSFFVDSFVFLTEQMNSYFKTDKPYIVIEGIVNSADIYRNKDVTNTSDYTKNIVYTGALTKKHGIIELLNAFSCIKNENYRLIICGDGEIKKDLIELSKKDNRITCKGFLTREEILKLQKTATVLINPRQNNEKCTKYFFPSKTMEYMLSGNPVLCYKLDGIPDEYDDFLIYFNDNSIETMIKRIIEVCEMDKNERKIIGEKARKFVLKNKNGTVQARKIVNMIVKELSRNA